MEADVLVETGAPAHMGLLDQLVRQVGTCFIRLCSGGGNILYRAKHLALLHVNSYLFPDTLCNAVVKVCSLL